ncbi:MAG TPA: LLM class flavin-dependent oxidoreductase [Flavobacteriaceae bacterium]|nr:LLM class flavin-dependent oxidoreductase [Flavobacteriaceae bacterium]
MAKRTIKDVKLSVLDLVPALEGVKHKTAIENSLSLAQHLDQLEYHRLWISEHHNTDGLLSSATVVILGYLLQGTENIRIGSGGIMLPNHAPLVVAEQMGTLETIYPNRVDLGLGRAPGTDQITAKALRRERTGSVHDFPKDVQELEFFLSDYSAESKVRAIPGEGTNVPIYLLGSSTFSAQLAAALGLPYVFASHFAPTYLFDALDIYRKKFRPAEQIEKPYTMAGVNVVVADTDEEAEYLATSGKQFRLSIIRNERRPLQPPVKDMEEVWRNPMEKAQVEKMGYYSFVGSPETVKKGLNGFIEQTKVDELIISTYCYDQKAQHRSFELLKELQS